MKSPSQFEGVFLHRDPVDLRRDSGIESDCGECPDGKVERENLFVFCGRRRHTIKILYFDRSGFCLWQKQLDVEKFPWPRKSLQEVVHISTEQLSWLLEGYDVWKMKPFSEINFERVC
ncbi:MAG: IS66 family insertion sequence element accessory protein TnpB [Bdellovibrionales bacterium]|nr:IS66 family insertion sequence element accessory protein TnpB [Bdellovibrionales bacterium]